jgi:hypothetical protein
MQLVQLGMISLAKRRNEGERIGKYLSKEKRSKAKRSNAKRSKAKGSTHMDRPDRSKRHPQLASPTH